MLDATLGPGTEWITPTWPDRVSCLATWASHPAEYGALSTATVQWYNGVLLGAQK